MSPGNILVVSIIVVSIILLVVAGIVTYKRVQPTLQKMNELKETINVKKDIYTREINHVNDRVNHLNQRVQLVQTDAEIKVAHFQDLMDEKGKFQHSLGYLKDHAGDYAKGISTNVKDEVKEDGPKIAETFKRAFKKTAQKQKVRFQK